MPLRTPDVLVCSVGTEIFFEAAGAEPVPDKKYFIESLGILQPDSESEPLTVTCPSLTKIF